MRRTIYAIGILLSVLLAVGGGLAAEEQDSVAAMESKGRATFRVFCSSCHGRQAKGDGPVAEVLTTKPADLTTLAKENGGEFPAVRVSKAIDGREVVQAHGSRDMPVWGEAFVIDEPTRTEEDVQRVIAELVAFLRSIQTD